MINKFNYFREFMELLFTAVGVFACGIGLGWVLIQWCMQ
jgi:hypothetical protein